MASQRRLIPAIRTGIDVRDVIGYLPLRMAASLRLALVEDNLNYRSDLIQVLELHSGWRVVAACGDSVEALRQLPGLKPELILVDLQLERQDSGLNLISRLKEKLPNALLVTVTIVDDPPVFVEALKRGAIGYILKGQTLAQVVERVEEVVNGGGTMSPAVARHVAEWFRHHQPLTQAPDHGLTPREDEILRLASRGRQQGEIAAQCGIAVPTVRAHFRNIYEKLQVHSRAEAVLKAYGTARSPEPKPMP